jgi:hypothetical protein
MISAVTAYCMDVYPDMIETPNISVNFAMFVV